MLGISASAQMLLTANGVTLEWKLLSGRDYHALHRENPAFGFEPELADTCVVWHPYQGLPAVTVLANGRYWHELTWMDAKIGDWVVTPRIGKPVEIQALWLNALRVGRELAGEWGELFGRAPMPPSDGIQGSTSICRKPSKLCPRPSVLG